MPSGATAPFDLFLFDLLTQTKDAKTEWLFQPGAVAGGAAVQKQNGDVISGTLTLVGGGGRVADLQGDSWCLGVGKVAGNDLSRFEVDAPFTVPLDATSQVTPPPAGSS
jgi:hypothetical protein